MPDLSTLDLTAFLGTLLLFAVVDTGWSVLLAVIKGNFNGDYLMAFLKTHLLLKVFPIFALAVVGHGVPQANIPATPAASTAAVLFGGLYLANTLASLKGSWDDNSVAPK